MTETTASTGIAYRTAAWLVAFLALWTVLYFGKPILMPLVLAVFTSMLIFPILRFLTARRLPGGVAIAIAQVVGFLPVVGIMIVFLLSVEPVKNRLPDMQTQLTQQFQAMSDRPSAWLRRQNDRFESMVDWVEHVLTFGAHDKPKEAPPPAEVPAEAHGGVDGEPPLVKPEPTTAAKPDATEGRRHDLSGRILPKLMSQGADFFQSLLGATTALIMNLFLVVLFTTFILLEAHRFGEKTEEAFGKNNPIMLSLFAIAHDVRTYLVAKTLISALTGLLVWIFLTIMEVEFAGFWGLAAFALNYIPNIGSVVASLPPILLAFSTAWLSTDVSYANPIIVSLGLLTIQSIIGSFMDPRMIGASLKLSPLVILISMLTWGLLWGAMGMILSVPIMVCFKIICSHVEGLQPIATLMKA